ncbi:type transcriptional regulator NorG [Seminavis robusta]|uniref:Type transcriptional regulator NorG n=1 Tax=Seminavis robusta TaxID=568900 RepID=A0A9N8HEX7_9STRA|nr:type transcriptional regulator NorG [Seminavis robusta]|eukprot:Sro538_g162650.1 type transcriptional regulator NorG (344) ;mRNA; f:44552-45583
MSSANEAPPDNLVNFGCGHPDYALLPVDEIASATQQALLDDPNGRKWLQYGRENGNYPARAAIAEFLTNLYHTDSTSHAIDPETLFVTSGVSHGIQLTCRTLDRVHRQRQQEDANEAPLCWVEDPTYFLVPPIFEQAGYELEAVRTSPDNGLDLSDLETKIRAARTASPDRLLVLYCIPIHHNPLGVSLSEETRTQLIHLCKANEVYLIADEVYHGLGFPGTTSSPTAMAMRGSSPYIVSVSAFTKLLCPGIRCGWIQTSNRDLLHQIGQEGVLDSGGCSSQLSSGIVRQLIQNGKLDSYLAALQAEYAKRCQHLCQLLQDVSEGSEYPFQFDFAVPQGGYFL